MTIGLLSILMLSAFIMVVSTNASTEDDVANYSCAGQVMIAHWKVTEYVTMDAVFAEQLKDDTGKIYQNALYVNVVHRRAPLSEDIIELVNVDIDPVDGSICIKATMDFIYYRQPPKTS